MENQSQSVCPLRRSAAVFGQKGPAAATRPATNAFAPPTVLPTKQAVHRKSYIVNPFSLIRSDLVIFSQIHWPFFKSPTTRLACPILVPACFGLRWQGGSRDTAFACNQRPQAANKPRLQTK